ncbi:MAG: hypothetical protein HC867_04025 [Bacteroidia bacterium]|nr:hypothetical protein [Bacteroidia bacterium]
MKMDRNTVLGFVLLALLFFGYFYFTRQGQLEYEKKQKQVQDSITALQPKKDTALARKEAMMTDSAAKAASAGQFQNAVNGQEKLVTVENDVMKITFTNKGAQPKLVELKISGRLTAARLNWWRGVLIKYLTSSIQAHSKQPT